MSSKGHVLIVDDEPDLVEVIRDQLRAAGFHTSEAGDGIDALEFVANQGRPDVILSDITMPRMNGLELLMRLRMSGMIVPFVFLSAYGDKEKVMSALRLGATDFLNKPFNSQELVHALTDAVELGRRLVNLDNELNRLRGVAGDAFASREDLTHYVRLRKKDS